MQCLQLICHNSFAGGKPDRQLNGYGNISRRPGPKSKQGGAEAQSAPAAGPPSEFADSDGGPAVLILKMIVPAASLKREAAG